MKRLIYTVLAVMAFSMLTPVYVAASDTGNAHFSLPYDLDVEAMTIEIMAFADCFKNEFPRELSIDDIDFSKAYKFYVDINVFEIDSNDYFQLVDELERSSDIVIQVPVFFENGDVYVANIQRRAPSNDNLSAVLSDEDLLEYEQKVGKWVVSAMFQYLADDVPFIDYYEAVQESADATGASPIFVGGLPYFRDPVAIFPDEDGNARRLIPLSGRSLSWHGLGRFENDFSKTGWLDYSEVRDYIIAHPSGTGFGLNGGVPGGSSSVTLKGTSFPWWILAVIAIVLSMVFVFFYW